MESKEYTQFGTLTLSILLPLLLVFIGLLINSVLSSSQERLVYLSLVITFLICLLLMYKLVIVINNTHITFKLGIGFIGKSYKISEIASCKPVRNSFIYGWGIHLIPNGWLYNVSGLKAIELKFKNSTKVVRIGTNQPVEIAEVITKLITFDRESEENMSIYKTKSQTKNTITLLVVVAVIILGFNYYGSMPPKINLKENQLEITGIYGLSVNYSDISAIDTIKQMPNIEAKTNGFAVGKVCKGNFTLQNIGNASLFINYNVSPIVQIILKNSHVIYFNLKDRQSTIETLKNIKSKRK